MKYLPLANILHYRTRSLLSAGGIALGICMMLTLSGLSRGWMDEVADRWEAVQADLIDIPRGWVDSGGAVQRGGVGLSDRFEQILLDRHSQTVRRVMPVFTWPIKLAGQEQRIAGVDSGDLLTLLGQDALLEGRLYDPEERFSRWIERQLLEPADPADDPAEPLELTEAQLSDPNHNGLEMVLDDRLASAAGLNVGDSVRAGNHTWRIVGIVRSGALARVFVPRRTAQYLFGLGSITQSTLMFVQLQEGVDAGPAGRELASAIHQDVVGVGYFRQMLVDKLGIMFTYVDAVNAIGLAISFLFITVTLYTMVIQRTRELAILKSSGATNLFLMRQVLAESLLLTAGGTIGGIGLSFVAAAAIQWLRPLLTVTVTPVWVGIALAAGVVGAVISGAYPAWRATRVDVLAALRYE